MLHDTRTLPLTTEEPGYETAGARQIMRRIHNKEYGQKCDRANLKRAGTKVEVG